MDELGLERFPRYGTSVVAGAKNKSVYMTNSNSFLNHNGLIPKSVGAINMTVKAIGMIIFITP